MEAESAGGRQGVQEMEGVLQREGLYQLNRLFDTSFVLFDACLVFSGRGSVSVLRWRPYAQRLALKTHCKPVVRQLLFLAKTESLSVELFPEVVGSNNGFVAFGK